MKKCPECAELVKKEARICRYCGYEFYKTPLSQEEEIEKYNHENEEI
jgi:rRNA maturation endonuclease Nob1